MTITCTRCKQTVSDDDDPLVYIHRVGTPDGPVDFCDTCFQKLYNAGFITTPYLTEEQYVAKYGRPPEGGP